MKIMRDYRQGDWYHWIPVLCFALSGFVGLLSTLACAGNIIAGPRAVGAFQSEDDGRCHAVVALSSGNIVDVTHDCEGNGLATTVLARLDGPVAISGYYGRNDHFRHVIVGTANGDLFDIRFKPGIPPAPIRLINIHGFGLIKSLASWADVHNNKNVAILTKWLDASVVSVYKANAGQPGNMHLLGVLSSVNVVDIAGEYVYWDNSNKIQIAVGAESASSSLKMISWSADVTPEQLTVDSSFEGTNTPWVTNFPGSNATAESIISVGAHSGYYSNYIPWSAILEIIFINASNQIKIFGANNGGGTMADGPFVVPTVIAQSVAGPHFTGVGSGATPRVQVVVAISDGRLFSLSASEPGSVQIAPAWKFVQLGAF